ncbi:ABC transporter ATP-binding protein [bacterium]|nr:MAG: ABC transporter ATP-binding protein [bacterium]
MSIKDSIKKVNQVLAPSLAIKVENVSKWFFLDKDNHNTFKSRFQNFFKKNESQKTKFIALDDINFEVTKGDFFGIIGRNGSGKSTLLKMIAQIYTPNIGKILSDGKIIPFLELGVGFNPELTGQENVYLNGTILGLTAAEISSRYDKIWDFAELREFEDMQIKHYSSGMMVRLAFAIAMEAKGDIYIMDEVLAVGDAKFQEKCTSKLEEKISERSTIIFVSHDLVSIAKYCNKVLYIKDHKVAAVGEPNSVISMYQNDLIN